MSDYQPAQRTGAGSIAIPAIRCFLIALLLALPLVLPVAAVNTPDVMLANVYRQHEDVTQFWMSEKLDGVRTLRAVSQQHAASTLKATNWITWR